MLIASPLTSVVRSRKGADLYAMSIAASISLARPTAAFRRASRGAAAPRRASLQTVAVGKNILYDVPVSNNGARNRLIVYWKDLEAVSYTHLTLPTIYSV